MCQNIDDFNRGCALVFARLYASFPRPIVLAASAFEEGSVAPPERLAVYGATVEFLAAEGYLVFTSKVGSEADRHFAGVRLTAKGLAALNRVPDAIRPIGKTVGDHLVEWGRDTLRDTTRDAARQLVGLILGAAT